MGGCIRQLFIAATDASEKHRKKDPLCLKVSEVSMHSLLAPLFLGHGHHGGRVMVAKIAYLTVSWKQRERQEGPETRCSLKAYFQ